MNKYMVIAFALMAVSFYELSGGADFRPGDTSLVVFAEPRPTPLAPERTRVAVARADMSPAVLTDIAPARAVVTNDVAAPAPVQVAVQSATDAAPVEVVQTVPAAGPDLRFIEGDRVNLRGGPGTQYAVIGKLVRNDMVEVIQDEGNGWLHLRAVAGGDEGWIAARLVSAVE